MVRFNVPISSILGYAYYRYELTASDYNPHIDDTIDITCKVTNVFGNNVSGKSVTLYQNGVGVSSATTDGNGVATWEDVQMSDWGLQDFNVEEAHCSVEVDGWKRIVGDASSSYKIYRNGTRARFVLSSWTAPTLSTNWSQFGGTAYASSVKPPHIVNGMSADGEFAFYINTAGNIYYRQPTGSTSTLREISLTIDYAISDGDL